MRKPLSQVVLAESRQYMDGSIGVRVRLLGLDPKLFLEDRHESPRSTGVVFRVENPGGGDGSYSEVLIEMDHATAGDLVRLLQ